MPDIFISYKKEERAVAAQLATRLTESGYDVWWDAALLAGERFEDEISAVLTASKAVIVLWSRKSVASEWVKAEAEAARHQKKALPAIIDDLPAENLPLLFRGLHVARLTGWSGEDGHPGFGELMKSIADRVGSAAGPTLSAPQAEAKLAASASEAEVWAAIAGSPMQSADEYRAYIKRFGADARFAELAEIRIRRLEARDSDEKKDLGDKRPPRRNWWPAIVLPLVALLVIAAIWGGLWLRDGGYDWLTRPKLPAGAEEARARCVDWSKGQNLNWKSTLPELGATTVADCELAASAFPEDGDAQALLALVRIAQDPIKGGDADTLANKGAALGSGLADFALGILYDYGIIYQADLGHAAKYYQSALGKKLPQAAGRLCSIAAGSPGPMPFAAGPDDVVGYCRTAASAGDAIGQAMLGYLYEYSGFGLQRDVFQAAKLYKQAADQGFVAGKVLLGAVDYRGEGIPHDPDAALALFKDAATTGFPQAIRWLAIANELGIGTPPDIVRAGQLYDQADQQGDLVSSYLLGFGPFGGNPLPDAFVRNEVRRLAGLPSDAVGQRMMAKDFISGLLGPSDTAKAQASLNRCAGTNAICQFMLGSFYKYGPPSVADITKAARLFEQSAAAGEMHGQYELGVMYASGEGEPKDLAKAADLFTAAAAQGNPDASRALNQLPQGDSSSSKS